MHSGAFLLFQVARPGSHLIHVQRPKPLYCLTGSSMMYTLQNFVNHSILASSPTYVHMSGTTEEADGETEGINE